MKHLFTLILLVFTSPLLAQIDTTEIDSTGLDTTAFNLDRPIRPREKRCFIEVGIGRATTHHTTFGPDYSELTDCRSAHESDLYVPIAEVRFGYQIKSWWSVSAGLQYFQTGFDFSEVKQLSDTLPMEFSIGCDVYNAVDPQMGFVWYGFYDPRFVGVIQGYHPSQATQNVKLRYHYLGLPVKTELSVFIVTTTPVQFILFVNGSITPNYMLKQLYDVSFSNESWNYVVQDSIGVPAQFIRRWNIGAGVGLGFTLMIRENCEVRFEFNGQNQLLNLFNWRLYAPKTYEEKHSAPSLKLSFRYYL